VAVLGGVEVLHHLLVLLGDVGLGELEHALVDASISGDASDLTGDTLHALLALDDGQVDVLHALHQVGGGIWGDRLQVVSSTKKTQTKCQI